MTGWFDKRCGVAASGTEGETALPHPGEVHATEESLVNVQDMIRRQAFDIRNLQDLVRQPAKGGCRKFLGDSLAAYGRDLGKDLQRMAMREGAGALDRMHRAALVARCASLCGRGGDETLAALEHSLRFFPGDEELIGLAERWATRYGRILPGRFRQFKKFGECASPLLAGINCVCSVDEGFWTGHCDGTIRHFGISGALLDEYRPGTGRIERVFADAAGRLWACDPLERMVVVIKPGFGEVRRMDVSRHMASSPQGISGCAGEDCVFLSLHDAETDEVTFLAVDSRMRVRIFFSGKGPHDLAWTSRGLLAIESYSRAMHSAYRYEEVLFTLPANGFCKAVRMTSLSPDTILVYGKDVMANYDVSGEELQRTSLKRYTDAYSALCGTDFDHRTAGCLSMASTKESRVHMLETHQ